MALMVGIKMLAEAPKDRRADELLHLLRKTGKPPALSIIETIRTNLFTPEVFDKHTLEGRRLGHGSEHFVKEGSKCTNMLPEYEIWRAVFEDVMLSK
jgi:hypothetical protein